MIIGIFVCDVVCDWERCQVPGMVVNSNSEFTIALGIFYQEGSISSAY